MNRQDHNTAASSDADASAMMTSSQGMRLHLHTSTHVHIFSHTPVTPLLQQGHPAARIPHTHVCVRIHTFFFFSRGLMSSQDKKLFTPVHTRVHTCVGTCVCIFYMPHAATQKPHTYPPCLTMPEPSPSATAHQEQGLRAQPRTPPSPTPPSLGAPLPSPLPRPRTKSWWRRVRRMLPPQAHCAG